MLENAVLLNKSLYAFRYQWAPLYASCTKCSTSKKVEGGFISCKCSLWAPSKFLYFWATLTSCTSKEHIFHTEFISKPKKKYNLLFKKWKKNIFFKFFFQNQCWPVVFCSHPIYEVKKKNMKLLNWWEVWKYGKQHPCRSQYWHLQNDLPKMQSELQIRSKVGSSPCDVK